VNLNLLIRDSAETDLDPIQAIYAHHVLHGTSSFELDPPGIHDIFQRRAAVLAQGLPYLVAERDGEIVGYAYATLYRPRAAYRHTCEDSVYVREGRHGLGIGRGLLDTLVARCAAAGWRQMLAVVGDNNPASLALHARCGFEVAGTLKAVGYKHGQWRDTTFMQRTLGDGAHTPPPHHA
ncbi:acetyltransferase, partial [Bordetella avium 197N]